MLLHQWRIPWQINLPPLRKFSASAHEVYQDYFFQFTFKSLLSILQLVSLLPDESFIDVIGGLVSHDLPSIQRKAIELLNTKLQQQKEITQGDVGLILLCLMLTTKF